MIQGKRQTHSKIRTTIALVTLKELLKCKNTNVNAATARKLPQLPRKVLAAGSAESPDTRKKNFDVFPLIRKI